MEVGIEVVVGVVVEAMIVVTMGDIVAVVDMTGTDVRPHRITDVTITGGDLGLDLIHHVSFIFVFNGILKSNQNQIWSNHYLYI